MFSYVLFLFKWITLQHCKCTWAEYLKKIVGRTPEKLNSLCRRRAPQRRPVPAPTVAIHPRQRLRWRLRREDWLWGRIADKIWYCALRAIFNSFLSFSKHVFTVLESTRTILSTSSTLSFFSPLFVVFADLSMDETLGGPKRRALW